MRERGLKYKTSYKRFIIVYVAPYAGAWIEITDTVKNGK